jgi:GNAT superfamily N-acetyltransferase
MVEIQRADQTHIEGIVELWKELMDYIGGIEPYFKRSSVGHLKFENYLREAIESESSLVLVAVDSEKVVGYANAYVTNFFPVIEHTTFGFISDFVVTSTHQRQGIGTQMFEEIKSWLDKWGIKRIELRVIGKNKVGYAFWKKHGFDEYEHTLFKTI